jgi:hypothetical protein
MKINLFTPQTIFTNCDIKEFIPFNASNVEVFHSSYLQMHVNVGSPSCQAQKQIYLNAKP